MIVNEEQKTVEDMTYLEKRRYLFEMGKKYYMKRKTEFKYSQSKVSDC